MEHQPASVDIKSPASDNHPYLTFSTEGKIIIKLSEKSQKKLKLLRILCIKHSPDGIPEKRDQLEAQYRKKDYLEGFNDVKNLVWTCFRSLIDDGCFPFVAMRLIWKCLQHEKSHFLTLYAIRRILDIGEMRNTPENASKITGESEYSFQEVSNNMSRLQRVANRLEKKIDDKIFLAGFYRHSTRDVNIAVYSDDLNEDPLNKDMPPHDMLKYVRDEITGEIEKGVIDALFDKYNYKRDAFMMELDPLSMLHFIKRLLLLHTEDPLRKRKIYYSPSRKRILKII